jgi:hypothetical protein
MAVATDNLSRGQHTVDTETSKRRNEHYTAQQQQQKKDEYAAVAHAQQNAANTTEQLVQEFVSNVINELAQTGKSSMKIKDSQHFTPAIADALAKQYVSQNPKPSSTVVNATLSAPKSNVAQHTTAVPTPAVANTANVPTPKHKTTRVKLATAYFSEDASIGYGSTNTLSINLQQPLGITFNRNIESEMIRYGLSHENTELQFIARKLCNMYIRSPELFSYVDMDILNKHTPSHSHK